MRAIETYILCNNAYSLFCKYHFNFSLHTSMLATVSIISNLSKRTIEKSRENGVQFSLIITSNNSPIIIINENCLFNCISGNKN